MCYLLSIASILERKQQQMETIQDQMLDTFKSFWYTWAARKNKTATVEDIKSFFDEEVTSIGTGEHERGRDYQEVLNNFVDDFSQLEAPIRPHFNWINTKVLSDTSGFIEAECRLEIELAEDDVLSFMVRMTSVLLKKEATWKIIHKHISIPHEGQNTGEAYPINKLRAQNAHLQKQVEQRTQQLEQEKEKLKLEKKKTEQLLYNTLPKAVAKELIDEGRVKPHKYEAVSVLFSDFVGFTELATKITPEHLIAELNELFLFFDQIVKDHKLEKIKTIGDAYMAAAGLPEPCEDHALRCIQAAQAMFAYLHQRNQTSFIKWQMRIGVHSGPVIAGIVGKHKFFYDLWGDTVNVASRLEGCSEAGRINISKQTYDLVKQQLDCQARGKKKVKGGKEIDMYFVK